MTIWAENFVREAYRGLWVTQILRFFSDAHGF